MTKTLKQRMVNSSSWVASGHVTSQLLRLGSNLILTRLLVPEMFGVMAIVSVLLAGISMFSDIGISQNIIQSKRGNDKVYINTAWTLQVLRGVLIFISLIVLSIILYYVRDQVSFIEGSVYSHPQLPFLLAAMSLTVLISGFNSINLALLNRNLKLKESTLIHLTSQVIGLAVMMLLAFIYTNIWALVIGSIISSLVKMLLSHLTFLGNKSELAWDKSSVREIFHFGKWIFGASIFTFLAGQGDRLILGGLLSAEQLGIYTIAFFLAMAFRDVVRRVMSSVFYPVLSEVVRNRPEELQAVYYKIRKKIDILIMIVVGLLASSGHVIIDFLYDERYQSAGWMLEILSLSTIFLGITMAGNCLLALGHAKEIMKLTAISALFLFISVPVFYSYFGIKGAIAAIAVNSLSELPLLFYLMRKYKILNWGKEFQFWPLFFISYAVGYYCSLLWDSWYY